jgi:mannose-6-phosphate isomerase-like protein (cupin superfamily)
MFDHAKTFETNTLPADPDAIAPDTSQIRLLGRLPGVSIAHGTLPPSGVSLAIVHRTVEEIWYVLSGEAEILRELDGRAETVVARAGTSLTIPVGTRFQFRTLGASPFTFIMCTVPPWPGEDEAQRAPDHWPVASAEV